MTEQEIARRAARLLRCYPKRWRDRYGDEFAAMIEAELADRPRSLRRDFDIVGHGFKARFDGRIRGGLRTSGVVAFAVVGLLAMTVWSQLGVAEAWRVPESPLTRLATPLMTLAVALFAVAAMSALIPGIITAIRQRRHGLALLALTLAVLTLAAGGHHYAAHWPGTAGHVHWLTGLLPRPVMAAGWAVTVGISSYWMHPHQLVSFPTAEVAWMVVSVLAWLTVAVSAAQLVTRRLPMRVLDCAAAAAGIFVVAAGSWLLGGGSHQRLLLVSGRIDWLGLLAGVAAFVGVGRAMPPKSVAR